RDRGRRHRPRRPRPTHADTHSPNTGATGETPEPDNEPDTTPPPQRSPRFSGEAQRRLHAARLWAATDFPYYSKALFSCPVIAAPDAGRIGIDEHWRIYASTETLETLTVEQAAAELIHVLNHALRDHAQRARNTGVTTDTATAWNVAADFEINDDLSEDGLDSDTWLYPDDWDLDDCLTAERYFRHILDNAAAVAAHTECGSGSHSHRAHHELDDPATALDPIDRTLLKHAVAAAVADHHKHNGAGSVPEGLARWAQQTLHPKVNWRQALAAALRRSAHHTFGAAGSTWQRPPRRQQPQEVVLRPAMARPSPTITIIVDTSASMTRHELDQALTEIRAIIATVVCGDSVRVLSVDTHIHNDQHIHNTNQITLTGAGGTDMATAITTAAHTNPDAIVVITDGMTPWPPTPAPGARSVIAALTHHHSIPNIPAWIQTIDITAHPTT
ncbi:MAG: VWA-like domain-containing protein, partial [Acidimicrobiaceae bacterium]|nr:VWA-like domain-containing protein [Acidimicrobiaceae bacterium]